MRIKAIKISTYGSGTQALDFVGIKPAKDHISWLWNITSNVSDNSLVWGITIYDCRYGNNKQGVPVHKYNLYSGSGKVSSNSVLTLMGPISSIDKHHSETPLDPYILLSA